MNVRSIPTGSDPNPSLLVGLITIGLAGVPTAALSQTYPSKPIRLVVAFTPGGGTDLVARAIARNLSDKVGQPVIVDNRPGAAGAIGTEYVAKAPADGYTLLMATPGSMTIGPNLNRNLPFDPLRDFAPITLATISPFTLVVHPSVPVRVVRDLIALAKASPGKLNYGAPGVGSVGHLATEQFMFIAQVSMTLIPYKGSSPAVVDLLGGQLDLLFENQPVVLPHIRAGRLRGIAVGTRTRSSLLPELPTMQEAGVPGYETVTAFGVVAPVKTAPEIVSRLNELIATALRSPEMKSQLAKQGLETVGNSTAEYARHLREESARYAALIKRAGITPQ